MKEKYYYFLAEQTGKAVDEIRDTLTFQDDFGMDSLKLAILYPQIEDAFHLKFSPLEDDFFEIFKTVGSLWNYISKKGICDVGSK